MRAKALEINTGYNARINLSQHVVCRGALLLVFESAFTVDFKFCVLIEKMSSCYFFLHDNSNNITSLLRRYYVIMCLLSNRGILYTSKRGRPKDRNDTEANCMNQC